MITLKQSYEQNAVLINKKPGAWPGFYPATGDKAAEA